MELKSKDITEVTVSVSRIGMDTMTKALSSHYDSRRMSLKMIPRENTVGSFYYKSNPVDGLYKQIGNMVWFIVLSLLLSLTTIIS